MLLESLETERLLIRALHSEDVLGFHSVWGDPERDCIFCDERLFVPYPQQQFARNLGRVTALGKVRSGHSEFIRRDGRVASGEFGN